MIHHDEEAQAENQDIWRKKKERNLKKKASMMKSFVIVRVHMQSAFLFEMNHSPIHHSVRI